MSKEDVQIAISNYIKDNYQGLDVKGKELPETIANVLTTIQDNDYIGAGTYRVVLDIYGTVTCNNGDRMENIHYVATCKVKVTSNLDGVPIPELNEALFIDKV